MPAELPDPTPATTDQTPPTTPETAPQPTPEPVAPAAPVHDPWLVHQAKELALSPDEIGAMSPVELQRSVVLLARQQARLSQTLVRERATPTPAPAPAPEPEWDLPDSVKAKLAEFDPAITEGIRAAGKANAEEVKRLRGELAKVQEQSQGQAHRQEVVTELSKALGLNGAPIKEGTTEFWQGNAILQQCEAILSHGILPPGTPPSAVIATAKQMLGFPATTTSTPAPVIPAPGRPTPTPTARPTNRLRAGPEGLSVREIMLANYEKAVADQEAEDATRAEQNGAFRP